MSTFDFACLLGQPQYDGYRELCARLRQSGLDIGFKESDDWQQLQHDLTYGKVPAAAICGLLYRKLRGLGLALQPVAAPLLVHPRYATNPGYWSEVIVRAGDPYQSLEELAGKTWLYNEEGSYSGYRSFLAELSHRGLGADFLGDRVKTGSHSASMERLGQGQGDFAVIDSTILDFVAQGQRDAFRVVHSIGPMAAPLVVCLPGYVERLQALFQLEDPPFPFQRFVPVNDADYDRLEAEWNAGLALDSGPPELVFVSADEGASGRPFTSLSRSLQDQQILQKSAVQVMKLLDHPPTREIAGGKFVHTTEEGLERHTYVMQPQKLRSCKNMALVGFLSRMKPEGDLKALFEADAKVLEQFHKYPGLLLYSPREYEPGIWGNLAIFESRDAQREWSANAPHLRAIRDLAEVSYENIRLHVGVWPGADQPTHWVATKYYHYTDDGVWRGVRCHRPLGK